MTTATPPGYLLVYADPGDKVTEAEFTDWYDNEHVPLRVDVPAFKSWQRWEAVDGAKPKWAASYDLTTFEATQVPPYTTLADTRSEREKRILRDVETLDRRTYEQLQVELPAPSALYDPAKPAPVSIFVGFEPTPAGEDSMNRWYNEEHIAMLAKCPGWIRSRRFVLKDWGQAGTQGAAGQKKPAKYLAVHEYASMEFLGSTEFKEAISTPWSVEVMKDLTIDERRVVKLYKSWESRL